MEYNYEINSESKTIYVITTGDLRVKETAEMGLDILMKAKELRYKIVFDNRLSRNKISIGDAYFWFSAHYDTIDKELKKIPTAYLVNENDWEFYFFFQCTNTNKGIPIKVFLEENAVLNWIKGV